MGRDKVKRAEYMKRWYQENKEYKREYGKKWRKENKQHLKEFEKQRSEQKKERMYLYYQAKPWMRTYFCARQRCNNPNNTKYKYYGGRGIKFLLTKEDVEHLYFRDCGFMMDRPSIDKIENDEDYTLGNCRFIEMGANTARANKGKKRNKKGQFIKKGAY